MIWASLSMSFTASKDNYNSSRMEAKLMEQGEQFGIEPKAGSTYTYVKTRGGHTLLQAVVNRGEVDYMFYQNVIKEGLNL